MVKDDAFGSSRERELRSADEGEVVVVPHDPGWARLYAREVPVIVAALRERRAAIEHFGSTAVPDLVAKPIIDILVGSRDALPPSRREIEALASQKYVFLGEDGRRPGRWFWRKRDGVAFNLSLVPFGSELWGDNLLVRDYLRKQPEEAQRYAVIKRQAQQASPGSLLGYQDQKREFVQELRMRARDWAQARGTRSESEP